MGPERCYEQLAQWAFFIGLARPNSKLCFRLQTF
jgi:hypothetical protein